MAKAQALTEKELRGITASFDLATEILLRGKVPKEREQIDLLAHAYQKDTRAIRGHRAVVDLLLSKPDSYFEPLLAFLQDSTAELPFTGVRRPDFFLSGGPDDSVVDGILSGVRAGKARKLYEHYPAVERWISETVEEVFGTLARNDALAVTSGAELFRTFSLLRFAYGQLLATLTPYLSPSDTANDEVLCSFASVAVSDIRKALLDETLSRLNSNPAFERHGQEFVDLVKSSASGRLRVGSLCSRSQFDVVRNSLFAFIQDPEQLLDSVGSFLVRTHFVELALPHLQEYVRRASPAALKADFFVPGQISSVDISSESAEPHVYVSFESHSDTSVVAVRAEESVGTAHNLAGIGLPTALDFAADDSLGIFMSREGKMFSSLAQRLVRQEESAETANTRAVLQGCIAVHQHKLADLWSRHPELLSIISEEEPTVVVFDGARSFVLGTALPNSERRVAFFAGGTQELAAEVLARAHILTQTPSIWLGRCLESPRQDAPEAPAADVPESELSRRAVRRDLRAAVHRTGQMKYRDFVSSLKEWGVVETTDGHGGHGSLKRSVDGRELRAGTWGALRDPDPNVAFGRIYEILENLSIPVEEYTQRLLEKRL